MIRRQLPAYSPVSPGVVWAGIHGAVDQGWARQAEDEVREALALRFRAGAVVLTDSGTSALRLALATAAREAPGPVALPAYGCYDLASAAIGAGVQVLLYDLDPLTLGPDDRSLRTALERGARTVVMVHAYGYPVALEPLATLCREAGALVIEDAAQAAGARIGGRPAGSTGPLVVLSFGRGKGFTGGGGGALLGIGDAGSRLAGLAGQALQRQARGMGVGPRLLAQWLLGRPGIYGIPAALPFLRLGETVYRPPHPPHAAAAPTGGVVRRALALIDGELNARRRNAERLLAAVRPDGRFATVQPARGAEPGYLRLPLLVTAGDCDRVAWSARHMGVTPGYPLSLADLAPLAPRLTPPVASVEGARRLAASLITLPTHSLLTEGDLRALERTVSGG